MPQGTASDNPSRSWRCRKDGHAAARKIGRRTRRRSLHKTLFTKAAHFRQSERATTEARLRPPSVVGPKAEIAKTGMRALVIALALLAALKIWVQDTVFRTAAEEAIELAYKARAADACTALNAADWSTGVESRMRVGNPDVSVHIWQFDHELWTARYRQPYLVLTAPGGPALSCTYDILAGTAALPRS